MVRIINLNQNPKAEEFKNDKHFSKIKIIRRQIKQLLIIPIIVEDKVTGIVNLENTSLNPDTIDLLKSFSEGVAVAIKITPAYIKKFRIVILKFQRH